MDNKEISFVRKDGKEISYSRKTIKELDSSLNIRFRQEDIEKLKEISKENYNGKYNPMVRDVIIEFINNYEFKTK